MKRYDKYKETSIDWIGEIPCNWEVKKIRYVGKLHTGSTPNTGIEYFWNGSIIWITPEDLSEPNIFYLNSSRRKISDLGLQEIGGELVPTHSIIISTRAPIGNMAIAQIPLSFNQGCKATEVDAVEHYFKYVYYALFISTSELQALGKGTTFTELSSQSFKDFRIPCPNKKEQTAIANYIDKKTAQLDKLIIKKEKLIELLNEEWTAVINHAITKGFNPNVKLKPSGIEWLDDIPEHWVIKKLKYVTQVNSTKKNYNFQKDSEDKVVFLSMDKVSENGIINQEQKKKIKEVNSGFTYFERGDIIVAKITPCFENGKGALLENLETNYGFGSTEFHTIRASNQITKSFIFYQTKTDRFMNLGEAFMTGSAGQKRVPSSFVEDFIIGLPSIEEQTQIVQHIQEETKKIDNAIYKIEKEIELIKEYRIALISEVVTGKIDVRNAG